MPTKAPTLFALPRAPRIRRMHVVDAGHLPEGGPGLHFACARCGYDDGWSRQTETISQAKRGRPCPRCNP